MSFFPSPSGRRAELLAKCSLGVAVRYFKRLESRLLDGVESVSFTLAQEDAGVSLPAGAAPSPGYGFPVAVEFVEKATGQMVAHFALPEDDWNRLFALGNVEAFLVEALLSCAAVWRGDQLWLCEQSQAGADGHLRLTVAPEWDAKGYPAHLDTDARSRPGFLLSTHAAVCLAGELKGRVVALAQTEAIARRFVAVDSCLTCSECAFVEIRNPLVDVLRELTAKEQCTEEKACVVEGRCG